MISILTDHSGRAACRFGVNLRHAAMTDYVRLRVSLVRPKLTKKATAGLLAAKEAPTLPEA
jgi:hypothetical protein